MPPNGGFICLCYLFVFIVDLQDLISRYIVDDDLAAADAASSNITVARHLYLCLMSSSEEGTLLDDWSDIYTPDELSFLVNSLPN